MLESQDKASLRRYYLKQRLLFNKNDAKFSAQLVAGLFIDNIDINKLESVAGYHPISGELDILPLLNILSNIGIKIAMPVIVEKHQPLIFRQWHDQTKLEHVTKYNLTQPDSLSPIITPQLVIVPLLAFDKNGYRLGYGGGYYDRTIEKLRKESNSLITVGVGYDFQLVEKVPTDAHDQRLDYIITNKEVMVFDKSAN